MHRALQDLPRNLPVRLNETDIASLLRDLAFLALPPEHAAAIIASGQTILGMGYSIRLPYDETAQVHSGKTTYEKESRRARVLHAEIMALVDLTRSGRANAAPSGPLRIFSTLAPCASCAQALVLLEVSEVHYGDAFENNFGLLILDRAGIRYVQDHALSPARLFVL